MIVAKTKWQRFRGLMFRKTIIPIVFPFEKESRLMCSIHSFFVFKTFKAIFVNEKWEVVDEKIVRPFSAVIPKEPCKYVIEVPLEWDRERAVAEAKKALTSLKNE